MSPPPRRRVPGPRACVRAPAPAAGIAGSHGLRGGGRRPDHLRLRRADPRFLLEFDQFFPGAGRMPLKSTTGPRPRWWRRPWRSSGTTVGAFPRPSGRPPNRSREPSVSSSHPAPRSRSDAVEAITAWLSESVAPGDIAVLSRVNSASSSGTRRTRRSRVPAEFTNRARPAGPDRHAGDRGLDTPGA